MSARRADLPRLPGDPDPPQETCRMIRVDHAGEYGAVCIYAGQLAALGDRPEAQAVRAMAEKEKEHLARFEDLMAARGVRPTVLLPFWHGAGYVLGGMTALLGPKGAMACTVAIEDVIGRHYADQDATLRRRATRDDELETMVATFGADERAHHAEALDAGAEDAPLYGPMTALIRAGARLAIWLSERF